MKRPLFACSILLLFLSAPSTGVSQLPVIPSTPVEETRISLLDGKSVGPGKATSVSNFRLFLKYSAEKPIQLELANHGIELPAGENATADVTFEHIPNAPATIHVQREGDLKPLRIEMPDSTISDGSAAEKVGAKPGKDFPMDGAFTLMARFHTKSKNGTLAARAPATGKWQPNGKTLFLRGGVLTYDIGWVGAIRGGPNLADGKEHIAVLTVNEDGHADLFVDGKFVAEKGDFTSEDDPKHVFKIGSTATNFGGDFKDGKIEQVMFWKRQLDEDEIASLGKKDAETVNTPDFHWKPGGGEKPKAGEAPELVKFGAQPGFATEIKLEKTDGATFHEAWIQPLEKSDHADLVASWNAESFERGKAIYTQLCVTCHGTATQEGSIPLSLKFHDPKAEFKNGNDPFRMWQTLTKGYGLMTPMQQYSTRQKYDVIHYIREEFLAKANPKQLSKIDDAYLAALPRGMSLVEEKEAAKRPPQYELMDFGDVLFGTYQIEPGPVDENVNIAQKGIAFRLDPGPGGVSKGKAWAIYDHDTMRLAAFYIGDQFVDWKGIDFDGSHGTHTSIVGERIITNPDQPGWANPETGEGDAPRVVGKDGRKFGPIPRDWAQFKGIHFTNSAPVLEYEVGGTRVHEWVIGMKEGAFLRALKIGKSRNDLVLRINRGEKGTIRIPKNETPKTLTLATSTDGVTVEIPGALTSAEMEWTVGPENARFAPPTPVKTQIQPGTETGPFAVDVLTVPDADLNPHQSWMRTSGFDFYPDGKRAAVCTWMGDVWMVEGIDQLKGELTWKRICSGLFQPLGLKIVDGSIYVTCRD
ncbi:MAG: hypothetical protein HKN23_02695, partial [Verrucomicrobiales bacterium]|nr:hypothetical protein [Verrucomicrobiales bacterium]